MASNSQDTCIDAYLLGIPSIYDTTFMDAYLDAIVSNYDELFGQLHLFNLAQEQLLQAICDDASEADLRAHLDCTLLNITDGANEEQEDFAEFTTEERENGKARLGPESPDMLARGRVYEKALGEARNNRRIEKFLVMELEKDANLTNYLSLNLAEVRRLKIACWAATCNFVHMVMALIHCRDEGDRKFLYRVLTIAVEFGYVELVKRLTELEEFDVNRGRRDVDFDGIHFREVGKDIQRTVYESGCLYYYAFSDRLTPLNLAAKLGNGEMVNTFLASKRADGALSPEGYWALHWAAKMGHAEVVNAILHNKDVNAAVLTCVDAWLIEKRLAFGFDTSFDRFDIGPSYVVSLTPLQLASFYGDINVMKLLKERLKATIEDDRRVTARQIATEVTRYEIEKILTNIPEMEKYVERLNKARPAYDAAANTILVVAALIASVSFASTVQPPSGYSPFFGSANLDIGAPLIPPWSMPFFCISNSLSFLFAIATLVVGAAAARPPRRQKKYIGVVLRSLRESLRTAYLLLYYSLACVLTAFVTAVAMVFPPIPMYFWITVIIWFVAGLLSTIAAVYFLGRLQLNWRFYFKKLFNL